MYTDEAASPMDIEKLTSFFMWCSVINGSLLILWISMCIALPDTVYRLQSKWFPISRDHYNLVMYSFLGLFKLLFLIFNLVPYLALLVIS